MKKIEVLKGEPVSAVSEYPMAYIGTAVLVILALAAAFLLA